MIDYWQAILLAFVQGLTEFLPISSSAHLVLPPLLFGWNDQGLAFDVAVHVGTLTAVVAYYRRDLLQMAIAWFSSLSGGGQTDESRLVWYLILATIPAGVVGVTADAYIEAHFRNLWLIAGTTMIFGILLGVADRLANLSTRSKKLTLYVAMGIGLAQALAPIPGVSRSGATITAALFLGLSRQSAARFSFLLSIPIIAAAGLLKLVQLLAMDSSVDWLQLALATAIAAVTAYTCIALFLRLLDRIGLMPFVWYRVLLALALAVIAMESG